VRENSAVRVLIVDDEALARASLRRLLGDCPDAEVVGEAANGFEAVKLADALTPDLLLLDIQMPKLSGFEVLELLGDRMPAIFVTAHDEHALKAFEIHAVDYLLKPVDPDRLREALTRARGRIGRATAGPSPRDLAEAARFASRPARRVLVREEGAVHVLPAERIDFIEARDDAVAIAAEGRKFRKAQKISDMEAILDPRHFVRVHRSYLLNVDRLARLELYAKDSWIAILRDGTKIPISRAGHARLRGRMA